MNEVSIIFYEEMLEYVDKLQLTEGEVGCVLRHWLEWVSAGRDWICEDRTLKLMYEMLKGQHERLRIEREKQRAAKAARAAAKARREALDANEEWEDEEEAAEDALETEYDDAEESGRGSFFLSREKLCSAELSPDTIRYQTIPNESIRYEAVPRDTRSDDAYAEGSRKDKDRGEADAGEAAIEALIRDAQRKLRITARTAGQLRKYCEALTTAVARYALEEALANGHDKWSYVRAILERYKAQELNDMKKIREDEQRFRNRTQYAADGKQPPNAAYQHHEYSEEDFQDLYFQLESQG